MDDFHRPLYPARVRQSDMLLVCTGLASHLKREGYWPKAKELCAQLKCNRAALSDTLKLLVDANLIARQATRAGGGRFSLEPKGWDLIGLAPIEPWRKPLNRATIQHAVNAAARRVMREEQAL